MRKVKETRLGYDNVIIVHEPTGQHLFEGEMKDCPDHILNYYVVEKITNKVTRRVYLGVHEDPFYE